MVRTLTDNILYDGLSDRTTRLTSAFGPNPPGLGCPAIGGKVHTAKPTDVLGFTSTRPKMTGWTKETTRSPWGRYGP